MVMSESYIRSKMESMSRSTGKRGFRLDVLLLWMPMTSASLVGDACADSTGRHNIASSSASSNAVFFI